MSFSPLSLSTDYFKDKDDIDLEVEFYNIPDSRIIDMLEEVYSDSESR